MRFYDARNNMEFDKNHPLWQQMFKTKAGTVRQSLNREGFAIAMQSRDLRLLPSVTTLSNIIDGFGTFGAGAAWGRSMTLQAVDDVGKHDPTAIKSRAFELMTEARDAGQDNHAIVEGYINAELSGQEYPILAAEDLDMARTVRATIARDVDENIVCVERTIASSDWMMGGRVDIECKDTVIEMKFPKLARKPKASEMAQSCAYAKMLGKQRSCLFMWDSAKRRVDVHWVTTDGCLMDLMCRARDLFVALVELWIGSNAYSVYLGQEGEF